MVSSDRSLSGLAEEFEAYRDPDDSNELSLVIDNSDRERPTLIVHIDREQAADLADRVEAFLRDHLRLDLHSSEAARRIVYALLTNNLRLANEVFPQMNWEG